MKRVALVVLLVGCESEAEVAAEMERGLRSSNEALVAALFTAEALAPVVAPASPARHGTGCGDCPCVSRSGVEAGPHQITLDYEAGCVPTSGLLPTVLQGHTEIAWTGAEAVVAWANLVVRLEDPVTGTLQGPVTADGDRTVVEATGDFALGPQGYAPDLTAVVGAAGVTVDGEVDIAGADFGTVALDGVELPFAGIRAACPTPDAGTATLRNPDDPDKHVIVDFGRPGDGLVTVERDGRVSEAVDLCAYESDRL